MKYATQDADGIPLCNFECRIVDETVRDDVVEQTIVFGSEGKLHDGRPLRRIEVRVDKFARLEWVHPGWGADATIWPGETRALPAAIQSLSRPGLQGVPPKKHHHVYTHTGIREVDGRHFFLHAGGAIGTNPRDASKLSVELTAPLDRFCLPEPPAGEELKAAILATLSILAVAPRRITYPLLAAVFRAPLGAADFSLSLISSTGVGKSELAALAQQHFGSTLEARNLPGGWASTANANERLAFLAKDCLVTIDEFAPAGSINDVSRTHRDADRIFRAAGNHLGRSRLRRDGTSLPPTPPRCTILSTGEDFPRGQSIPTRQLFLEVTKGDVDFAGKLTRLQVNAANGVNAAALAGYLQWLLPSYGKIIAQKPAKVSELCSKATSIRQHARTPSIVAELAFGFFLFLKFAHAVGAITEEECELHRDQCWLALLAAAEEQGTHQTTSDPAKYFLSLVNSALGTGRVNLASFGSSNAFDDPAANGWREETIKGQKEWSPRGNCIGWAKGKHVYLDRESPYAEIQSCAQDQGQSISISLTKLCRALDEQGLLAATGKERGMLAVRRKIHGRIRQVLMMLSSTIATGAENLPKLPTVAPTTETAAGDGDQNCSQSRSPDNRWRVKPKRRKAGK